jgi:hypothetical protein
MTKYLVCRVIVNSIETIIEDISSYSTFREASWVASKLEKLYDKSDQHDACYYRVIERKVENV